MCQVGAEGDEPGLPLVLADDEVPPREIDIAHAQAQCLAEARPYICADGHPVALITLVRGGGPYIFAPHVVWRRGRGVAAGGEVACTPARDQPARSGPLPPRSRPAAAAHAGAARSARPRGTRGPRAARGAWPAGGPHRSCASVDTQNHRGVDRLRPAPANPARGVSTDSIAQPTVPPPSWSPSASACEPYREVN